MRGKMVLVTGDITVDWNLARLRKTQSRAEQWNPEDTTRACWQFGGSALLEDLVRKLAQAGCGGAGVEWTVLGPTLPGKAVAPGDPAFAHSYTMWAPLPATRKQEDQKKRVWRIEEFLGMDGRPDAAAGKDVGPTHASADEADIVVIDDASLGYRHTQALWPAAIMQPDQQGIIVVKMASPIAKGELWQHLITHCTERMVVVIDVNDLRGTEVTISRELSWERAALDVYWELTHNPKVNALSLCRHVVVSFGTAGALLLSRRTSGEQVDDLDCRLYFDPGAFEGSWEEERPGRMIGYATCLTAAIVAELMLGDGDTFPVRGICNGIQAMRTLHEGGYGPQSLSGRFTPPAFPTAQVVEVIMGNSLRLPSAKVPGAAHNTARSQSSAQITLSGVFEEALPWRRTGQRDTDWTILDDKCGGDKDDIVSRLWALRALGRDIVRNGVDTTLKEVPLGRFGKVLTADRQEIESYRCIRALIATYCAQPSNQMPLSIAVLGPPGSGKSFGVKQVADSVAASKIQPVSFNLSQFSDPSQIVDALHQVRDVALTGRIPLVFWDEFDGFYGRPLGWLRYFLAPMQDGTFQDKQITHHIGKSIFVFAGGTCGRMEDFGKGVAAEDMVTAKAPDFQSRLRGFVNIVGPNPIDEASPRTDPHHVVRRSIILRSLLERMCAPLFTEPDAKGELRIDVGVLRAFLELSKYRHGVRSMEAIIGMSMLNGRMSYERSCLPPLHQLDLHVDGAEFLAIVERPELEGELLDQLAKAVYEIYCSAMPGRLDTAGAPSPPFQELPESEKNDNRKNVRDIGRKLDAMGCVMIPRRRGDPRFEFSSDDLDLMARLEHERWYRDQSEDGWRWAKTRDNDARVKPLMLPWRKLSPKERKTTVEIVRSIPDYLQRAGYTCKRLGTPLTERATVRELRIACTGHRVITDTDRLSQSLMAILDRLDHSFPGCERVLFSPLAEGAVTLITSTIMERAPTKLIAVLPMAESDYLEDFLHQESRRHFKRLLSRATNVVVGSPQPVRDEAYRQVDYYIVDQSDVLIAFWDGEPAQGPGGTAESVERAKDQRMPVFQVKTGNRKPGTNEPTSLAAEQGKLVIHNEASLDQIDGFRVRAR